MPLAQRVPIFEQKFNRKLQLCMSQILGIPLYELKWESLSLNHSTARAH